MSYKLFPFHYIFRVISWFFILLITLSSSVEFCSFNICFPLNTLPFHPASNFFKPILHLSLLHLLFIPYCAAIIHDTLDLIIMLIYLSSFILYFHLSISSSSYLILYPISCSLFFFFLFMYCRHPFIFLISYSPSPHFFPLIHFSIILQPLSNDRLLL